MVLFAGGLLGCAQNLPQRQYYMLEAPRPGEVAPAAGQAVLLILPFRLDAAFAGRPLIYRVSEFRYESDYYHQFLVAPEVMLGEKTRTWLAGSGLFRQVVTPGSPVSPTWTLTGTVTALYADFAPPAAPAAVLEIRVSLRGTQDAKEMPVFAKTYRVTAPVTDRTADAVVAALSGDLREILTQLETDLSSKIKDQTANIKDGGIAAPGPEAAPRPGR